MANSIEQHHKYSLIAADPAADQTLTCQLQ